MARASPDRVVWCDRGWQPLDFGFCPTRKAWDREMRRLGMAGEPYPSSPGGCVSIFERDDGATIALVTLCEGSDQGRTWAAVAGLLVHEAAHVWQEACRVMGESEPSAELEAYALQHIFLELHHAYETTWRPPMKT